ncbi:hypothetical protein CPB84DRAFT_1835590 [Gymnopilus junonius]|uniref:Uncharacterized protein n=1 Tax=Gymnopilus junonius TaxID=109634 RepID=A0A9P5TQY6_GYMJU|nr:hypothetical protein CPB84DRAFT_1835590 [Gymnopilus junonius]
MPGLALAPASEARTLTQIAITEGFDQHRHSDRCLHIGIDARLVIISGSSRKSTRHGENPALRTLFYQLCQLLALPVNPNFTFDGPNRPAIKRDTEVKPAKPHYLTLSFQKFIEAFGFHWHTDSDTFVFGASCVIRMSNVTDEGDWVTVYSSAAIQADPEIALDRAGLFLMAILCGGDYNKEGLPGCGWQTACQLAQTDLAHRLFTVALTSPSKEAMRVSLIDWRKDLRTVLTNDPQNVLGRRYPQLAKNVTPKFPSIDVLLLYARPITSWTANQIPNTESWHLRPPDPTAIANHSEKYFSWGSHGEMIGRFREKLWPGIVFRYLLMPEIQQHRQWSFHKYPYFVHP